MGSNPDPISKEWSMCKPINKTSHNITFYIHDIFNLIIITRKKSFIIHFHNSSTYGYQEKGGVQKNSIKKVLKGHEG